MLIKNRYKNILCVIPARGGSQGIIDKNLQIIDGEPLVEHSIRHACNAGLDHECIYVSSDSDKILDIATKNYDNCLRPAVVGLKRPESISGALSSTEETLIHAVEHAKHFDCDHVLLLQATSPIRFKGTVNKFLDFYLSGDYDSALTTTEFYDFFWRENENGIDYESTYDPENRPMRQAFQPYNYVHFDNGNMYLTSVSLLQEKRCRLGGKVGIFPISELEGMQIDTPQDLDIFRIIFNGELREKTGVHDV